MARDNTKARLQLQLALLALDGIRPSGTVEWVSAAAPVVTQAAVGAGHWAAGRRQRALAAWACAAGSALAAWGLGTEAPTRAEMIKNTQQHRDQLRKLGTRLLAGIRSPRMGRKPKIWTAIDRDYENLRIGMQTLFQHVGIDTLTAAA